MLCLSITGGDEERREAKHMFNQINGLPLHPLMVHAAVVLVPLAALLGVLFAIPRTRAWSRVPLVIVSVAAVGAVFVAKQSGQALQKVLLPSLPSQTASLVHQHAQQANVLFLATLGYAVLAVVAYLVTRRGRSTGSLATVAVVLVVIGALGVAFQTYRVGELGARAVWNPTGQMNYGSSSAH
jgi:glucan phosphoethanolaminetransferase (alkaline phosphatase superfamily)